MDELLENAHFDQQKSTSLSKVDLSKKGSVDEPIQDLVNAINQSSDFFTTSSCSGRALLFSYETSDKAKKSDCHWHFTSHHPIVDYADFTASLDQAKTTNPDSSLILKFEPFVLHVQSRSLSKAKTFHTCALECGYRNSGLTLGKGGKVTVAVRSTLCLEVPLGPAGGLLVSDAYLRYLVMNVIKDKFDRNTDGIKRFEMEVKAIL